MVKSENIWLKIIETFGKDRIPNLECHQRLAVYYNYAICGFNHIECLDYAFTCDNLPHIVFDTAE